MGDLLKTVEENEKEYLNLCKQFVEDIQKDTFGDYKCYGDHVKHLKQRKKEDIMSSGDFIEGNCKKCGGYTKSSTYQWDGLCLACASKASGVENNNNESYDIMSEDGDLYTVDPDNIDEHLNKINHNQEKLVNMLKDNYESYIEFKEVKFMLELIGYKIETNPELKIWKEV